MFDAPGSTTPIFPSREEQMNKAFVSREEFITLYRGLQQVDLLTSVIAEKLGITDADLKSYLERYASRKE